MSEPITERDYLISFDNDDVEIYSTFHQIVPPPPKPDPTITPTTMKGNYVPFDDNIEIAPPGTISQNVPDERPYGYECDNYDYGGKNSLGNKPKRKRTGIVWKLWLKLRKWL